VRHVAWRSILYHVGAVLALGWNVSSLDPILKNYATQSYSSPFELMFDRAGLPVLKHIVNAVVLVALLSVANARLYVSVQPSVTRFLTYRAEHYMLWPRKAMLSESSKKRDGGMFRS